MENDLMEKSKNCLSRLLITGNIDINTPICVLYEIAVAHGVKVDISKCKNFSSIVKLVKNINETETPVISQIKYLYEFRFVARFVNKKSVWTTEKLMDAYNFLLKFTTDTNPLDIIPNEFDIGPQTSENPYSINCCVLYKTCIYHGIRVNSDTTIEQMSNIILLLRDDINNLFDRALMFLNRDAKYSDIINILMLDKKLTVKEKEEEGKIDVVPNLETTFDQLSCLYQSLNDIEILQNKIEPTTVSGSIALAAINFNIDISRSSCPIKEYKMLKICRKDKYSTNNNKYIPVDNWMKYWYLKNKNFFNLNKQFNPIFPVNFYNNNLIIMIYDEGYDEKIHNNTDCYELLQLAYISETFYEEEIPICQHLSTTKISLDEVSEIKHGELIWYGQIGSLLIPISVSELIDLFTINQNFTNPFESNSIFSPVSITKLERILSRNSSTFDEDTFKLRKKLYSIIIRTKVYIKSDEPTRNLIKVYNSSNIEDKNKIKELLLTLLHIGMYMRGWNGIDSYPVKSAIVTSDEECKMFVNVTNTIIKYEQLIVDEIGDMINNLPLVIYKANEYQVSNKINEGFTIGQRINIIKDGENTSNVLSCIRLSSNWICSSSHKYMTMIGLDEPFDIFYLRHIQ